MSIKYVGGNIESTHSLTDVYGRPYADNDYWVIMQHQTDFLYFKDGCCIEGKTGQILIIPPFTYYMHGASAHAEKGFVDDWMWFNGEISEQFFSDLGIPLETVFDVSDAFLIKPYITKINLEYELGDLGYEDRITSYFLDMFVEIARQKKYSDKNFDRQRVMLDNVRQEMLANYGNQFTLDELAAKVGYSSGHFAVLYRKYYNISPIDDLISYRISVAKLELRRKESSITEISKRCGFASIHHFSRFFKKYVGVSPSVYRNM